MGNKPTPSEEEQRLRQATREAHEALQGLTDAIKQARKLVPALIQQFEWHHQREMEMLSNHMVSEQNRLAADLNAAVTAARDHILYQLTAQDLVLNPDTGTISLVFNHGEFVTDQPPPYPNRIPKETRQ